MAHDFDFFVIGAGSGGVRAARIAAGLGARVAICEDKRFGGTCVNVGCVPKKLLVYGSHFAQEIEAMKGFGWHVEARFEWSELVANKDREIARLNGIYERLLENAGVTVISGRGRLVGPHAVQVGGRTYTAAHILIATGSRPVIPDIPGRELGVVSDALFSLPEVPKRIVMIGGGFIGVEFACIFQRFGAKVDIVQRAPTLLRDFDDETCRHMAHEIRERGIGIHLESTITSLERTETGLRATYSQPGPMTEADLVVFAAGRKPNTHDLGLEEVGVECGRWDEILVDEDMRTCVPSIYAVGDVVGRMPLTPVALAEGMAVARSLFGHQGTVRMDYTNVPVAVFSQPTFATVGLTEEQARKRHDDVVVYKSSFRPMKHTLTDLRERTFVKVLVDGASDRVLGCHMLGPNAAEIVQGLAVAMKCGLTKTQLDSTIGIHPTAAEEFVTLRTPAT